MAENRVERAHYSPPWADTSIIGIAGSSGSGKSSLAMAIVTQLNLPWVVILSMDSFYRPLTPEESRIAFRNEFDFDAPHAIDFEVLIDKLREIKRGHKTELPVYSFEKHNRLDRTTTLYSPHVLILEGIFALHDERVLDMLDLKIFADAEPDLCLSRRLQRDVRERGRDIEGCIKQWFAFVKPNFKRYVEPQKLAAVHLNYRVENATIIFRSYLISRLLFVKFQHLKPVHWLTASDIIVPRGIENKVAISMVSDRIHKTLAQKSRLHQVELKRLGKLAEDAPLSKNVILIEENAQIAGINSLLADSETVAEDFIFYFDRLVNILVERATTCSKFVPASVQTPTGNDYAGLRSSGQISAALILRGGSCLETGLKRVIPDCPTGRILIQNSLRTGEPELHFYKLPGDIASHELVLLLDSQMSSGGSALMAVRVLLDHGVPENKIVLVTYMAGKMGINRLMTVFPDIRVVACRLVDDHERRWIEQRYLGC